MFPILYPLMNKPLCTFVCLLMAINSIAQTTFQKEYTGPRSLQNDHGLSCIYTKQGSYFITGYLASDSSGMERAFLSQIDSTGYTINQIYRGLDISIDSIAQSYKSVIQTKDGRYCIIAGEREAADYKELLPDFLMMKLDNQLGIHWEKAFGGDSTDIANSVIETFDNSYIIAGQTNSFGAGSYDMYVCKVDENGKLLWTRTIGGTGNDYALSLTQTKDSNLVLVGYTNSFGAGNNDVYIVKLNKSDYIIWSRTLGGSGNDVGTSVIEGVNGDYILCGYSNSFDSGTYDAYLAALDTSGSIKWTKTIGGTDDIYPNSIIRTNDAGYAMAGYESNSSTFHTDAFVIKVDVNVNIQWAKGFGGPLDDYVSSITQVKDNAYLATGSYADSGTGDKHVYIAKLDSLGNICNGNTIAVHTNSGGNLFTPASSLLIGGKIYNAYSELTNTYKEYADICSEILPLKLLSFTAQQNGKVNELRWETMQEVNINHFDMERSINGKDFTGIGTQKAKGNSTIRINYSFVDMHPYKGINYYRLRIVDNDGRYEYSSIKRIANNENDFDAMMLPNPARDNVTLFFNSEKLANAHIDVFNLQGSILIRKDMIIQTGSTTQKINISSLSSGNYFVRIKTQDQQLVFKLVKQ